MNIYQFHIKLVLKILVRYQKINIMQLNYAKGCLECFFQDLKKLLIQEQD